VAGQSASSSVVGWIAHDTASMIRVHRIATLIAWVVVGVMVGWVVALATGSFLIGYAAVILVSMALRVGRRRGWL
jgi:hypothetical protein